VCAAPSDLAMPVGRPGVGHRAIELDMDSEH
jgi:hypothetical protein